MTEPREPTDQLGIGATDMTDNTQPEALRLAEQYDYGDPVAHSNMWKAAVCNALRRQHARIAELESRVQELGAMARENRSRRIVELEAQLMCNCEWQSIETAPRDGARILLHPAVEVHDGWSKGYWSEQQECWLVGGSASGVTHAYWHPLPPSPSSADERGWIALPGTQPEPGTPVLLDIGKKYPIRAMWAAKFTLPVGLEDDSGFGEYDEATETYYCPEGWYEWNECEETNWRVTETPRAWAPLPPTTSAGSGKGG